MEAMRVLVVEDDVKMASLLRRGLVEDGLAADVALTGDDALWMAGAADYDAIVLDVMIPGPDGFEVCRRLREAGTWAPVLMLTARSGKNVRERSHSLHPHGFVFDPRYDGAFPLTPPKTFGS
jgi:two-component system OmpR family response regulator